MPDSELARWICRAHVLRRTKKKSKEHWEDVMQNIKKLIIVFALLVLSGCGTTTGLTKNGKDPVVVDLSNYQSIIVEDFTDGTEKKSIF